MSILTINFSCYITHWHKMKLFICWFKIKKTFLFFKPYIDRQGGSYHAYFIDEALPRCSLLKPGEASA
jgi:hypothetical protein